jgi:hypothetical protein
MNRCLLLLAAILTSACSRTRPVLPLPIDSNFGVINTQKDGACLSIKNPSLAPNTTLYLIVPEYSNATTGTVLGPDPKCREEFTDSDGFNYYRVTFKELSYQEPILTAVAIANYKGPLTSQKGALSADLNGDGVPEQVHQCLSAEGAHYTIWSGPPVKGKLLWHYYFYVPYSTEPSCKEPGEVGVGYDE